MPDTLTSKKLREQRAKLVGEARKVLDKAEAESREMNAEERSTWARIMGDVGPDGVRVKGEEEVLKERIDRAEQIERCVNDLDRRTGDFDPRTQDYDGDREKKRQRRAQRRDVNRLGWNAPHVTEEDRANVLQGWMRAQSGLSPKQRHEDAAKKCGMTLARRHLDIHLRDTRSYRKVQAEARAARLGVVEGRAQALNPNTAGGFLVPEGFVQNLEIALLAYANVRQWADVMRTASGQDLPWPTVNDTTVKGKRIQENTTVSESDMTLVQAILHAYKYTSGLVQVPVELMEDSAFDLAAILGELLGIRIGRIQADEFTTGLGGAGQPQGYVTGATQGIQAASSTAIAGDDLYGLKHAVDPAYRALPGVGWTFHDKILLAIKKLKDGMGRYLWQAGLAGGAPDTVDDDPYYINQSMASVMTTGNKTVVYGALKKFKIRDVSQVRLRRLVERYADSDQEGFVMFMRSDSVLLDAGTHPVQYLVH